ncbi:tyrosinase [Colletotrichum liriopes]|uniref:tyrosinase n=1 Tax=Colletotrichum liriopes TaxID=708192 RepID=A0AA37LWA4_9PEZI|nr:tyrosinase [Colletotrichum liriopes]
MNNSTMDQLDEAHKQGIVLGLADFGVEQRVDIDVMLTEQPDTFNLFLIALMELQGMDKLPWQNQVPDGFFFKADGKQLDLRMSWFQLAAELRNLAPSVFGNDGVANVAKRFSESDIPDEQKKKYLAAAQHFRIPYWDYYRPRGYNSSFPGVSNSKEGTTTAPYDWGAPQIFTLRQVMVRRLPDNELVSMPNPFFQFQFNSEQFEKLAKGEMIPPKLTSIEETIRHGGSDADATKKMNDLLNSVREDHIRLCLAMIEDQVYRNFRTFSTNAVVLNAKEQPEEKLGQASGSIEDFHGKYHVTIGGPPRTGPTGHMSHIAMAAFDPIFWMHHCQIDRLFAIWQAANGEKHWFNELAPEQQGMGKDNLTPFRKWPLVDNADVENRYWNSDRARNTKDFGYTYPELADGQTGDTVREDFAKKYEWSRRTTAKRVFGTPPDGMQPIQVGKAQVFQYTSDTPSGDLLKQPGFPVHRMQQQTVMTAMTSTPQYSDDWYIDIVVER